MQINLIDDSSVNAAPTGFTPAIAAAAQFLDNLITNPITVNVLVGWGEYDNGTYSIGNNISLGGALAGIDLNYSQLRSDLIASASTAVDKFAVTSLPISDPTNGESFFVSDAEAKALGLLPANGSEMDGAVGFNANYSYNFNTNGQAVPGELDLVSDAELELAHALGMLLGTAMMLFRYSAPGVRELTVNGSVTPSAYFSIDKGNTNLNSYDTTSDSTLWNAATAGNDTFAIPYSYGEEHVFSLTDATELNVLGYNVNASVLEENGTIYGSSGNDTLYVTELPTNAAFNGGGGYNTIIFDGSSNQYSIVRNGTLNVTVTDTVANRDGSHMLSNVEALQFTDKTVFTAVASEPPSGTTADMILRHGADGLYEIYDIGNNAILASYQLGQVGTDWGVVTLGGFNGTDTTDMILRSSSTGAFEVYDISNNNITNTVSLGQVGLEWQVAGFGNFSSRGETDMLIRDSNTGNFDVLDISNNAVTFATSLGPVGLNWQVAGFGNFSSRAGETDMLIRDSNTGNFDVLDISNNAVTFATSLGPVGLNWQVVGIGNFSGIANESDLLIRDNNTGNFDVLDISHNAVTSAAQLGQVGLEWAVAGVAPDPPSGSTASTAQFVQAMASFGVVGGVNTTPSNVVGSTDPLQHAFLTMPQHG